MSITIENTEFQQSFILKGATYDFHHWLMVQKLVCKNLMVFLHLVSHHKSTKHDCRSCNDDFFQPVIADEWFLMYFLWLVTFCVYCLMAATHEWWVMHYGIVYLFYIIVNTFRDNLEQHVKKMINGNKLNEPPMKHWLFPGNSVK